LIKKILVALDGSEQANKALDFALGLAETYSAELMLLNVYQPVAPFFYFPSEIGAPPMAPPMATPIATAEFLKELKAQHEKVLSEALKKANRDNPNLKVTTMLSEGRPSNKIIEVANEGKFDLIVMGSRGMGRIKEIFLGSVSDRVADEAKCSVLIVK
jgi:nucleotide-binding universal stress UspA family protein